MFNPNLQPLRIPTGWSVSWNAFHEEDPTEATIGAFSGTLFAAEHRGAKIAIDLEWSPKNMQEGRYVVAYFKYTRPARTDGTTLLATFESRNRLEIVTELERFMVTLIPPTGAQP